MRTDDEIKERLERSLRNVGVPHTRPDAVIARGKSLRRRHRAVGVLVAGVGVVALIVPLALLWPLRAGDEGRETGPASEPGRLVVAARVPIGRGITDVATGFGSVWVTGNNGVTQVDPETSRVLAEIHVPGTGDYSHIATGEGSVWVTAPELRPDGSRGNLVRIDPATKEITATVHIGGPIVYLAVGGGSVWVSEPNSGASTVFRVDPGTERVIGDVEVNEGAGPLMYGFGSIWVSNTWVGDSVTRIDAATGRVVGSLDAPSAQAVGDGSLWGATGDSVIRIDPDSGAILATIPIARAQSVTFDGSTAWVLVSPRSSDPMLFEPIAGTAAVARIDAATDQVIGEPVPLEDLQPLALVTDDRGAWVADYYDGFLSRITAV
jgi:hypothetical protein